MGSIELNNLNTRIKRSDPLLKAIESPDFEERLRRLDINWKSGSVNQQSDLFNLFLEQGFIDEASKHLTKTGMLFFSRSTIDFESELTRLSIIGDKYKIVELLEIGKNSVVYIAEHVVLGARVVLKFIRPGAADNIIQALRLISGKDIADNLILPQDYIKVALNDIYGNQVDIECIVYQYLSGVSLKEFLNNEQRPLNAHAIASFIKQIGGVLYALEQLGAYHGDLHEENIIVDYNTNNEKGLTFYVIDVSYGITGSLDSKTCKDTDVAYFRQHLWNFLSAQQRYLAKMSIRKYLGAEIFFIVTKIVSAEVNSFKEILALINENAAYADYQRDKKDFINEKFARPGSFKLQRYEEITDPKVAVKLFVPFPELMENISAFSNVVITGNRGSGKSTYLATIAFFPQIDNPQVDFRDVFGIYFPCRQGEFRLLSPEMIDYESIGIHRVKHVMIIKILRRTLESINDGLKAHKISDSGDYSDLKRLLSVLMGNDDIIISLSEGVVSEITNLVSILVRIEMKELDNLFHSKTKPAPNRLCSEIDLLEFFKVIRKTFVELSNSRFHLLFDDAGTPNIPAQAQYIINDFIVSSNPVYCIKLSTELYSYNYQTSEAKQLESGHDYYAYDMSRSFFSGANTFGLNPSVLQDYLYKIISKRLENFNYKSNDILDYLSQEFFSIDKLVYLLSVGKRDAYYCGWSVVWHVADRNPRNLLELISEILSVGGIGPESEPSVVRMRNQDRAIRSVSEKRLRSLAQISGTVEVGKGQVTSLGQQLFDITTVLGSVFRIYLKSEPKKGRKDQYLALERNESSQLNDNAEELLKEMIRYGILDPSRLDFARDDRVKKPIYVLNRIYCPAFGIGIRRDQHLRLSQQKFEELFLSPKSFVISGTKRLRSHAGQKGDDAQQRLFDSLDD